MTTKEDILNHLNRGAVDVPERLTALCLDIIAWTEKDGNGKTRNASESFAGYSVSRATSSTGEPQSWQDVFRQELNVFRKPKVL